MITLTLISQIAIVLILLGGLFYIIYKRVKGTSKELPKIVFGVAVFIAGLMLNWTGLNYFYHDNENPGIIFNVGTILSSTLRMFGFNWDRSVWSVLAKQDSFYSIAITLCYIAAAIISSSVILQILFKVFVNFSNSLSLFFRTYFAEKILIITGKGVHQKIFLKSIAPEQKKSNLILLNEISEETKKEYLDQGFLVINGKLSVALLKKRGIKQRGLFDLKKETTIIAISDNDAENLETARTITEHFQTLYENTLTKLSFSARIMYTNIERTEHFNFSEHAGGTIQFFNPYEITARSFLFNNPITKFIPSPQINTKKA
jgi:hypothetical protein